LLALLNRHFLEDLVLANNGAGMNIFIHHHRDKPREEGNAIIGRFVVVC